MKIILKIVAITAFATLVIVACNKSATNTLTAQPKALTVHLTDDPTFFSSVFIDIKYVEVKVDEDLKHDIHYADDDNDADDDKKDHDQFGKWDTLNIKPGIYDIAKLRNGLDTVLAKGNIPAGRIGKVRLTLGTNNSVIVNNISKPLVLAPGKNNYVYIKIKENDLDEVQAGKQDLWIDFDLLASIKEDNGVYYIRPAMKAYGMVKYGRIEGKVLPKDSRVVIKAYIGKDTTTAIPEDGSGNFKIRGLIDGNYSILVKSYSGYKDTTIINILVQKGKETNIPLITLHK